MENRGLGGWPFAKWPSPTGYRYYWYTAYRQVLAPRLSDERASKAPGHTGRQDAARARSERKASVAATQAYAKNYVVQKSVASTDGLLEWCKAQTFGYAGVAITNFSSSWNDGLAFCALLHRHVPDAIPFASLNGSTPEARERNFELAFSVAEKKLGVIRLLDVEDMMDTYPKPDTKSVTLYVSQIANAVKEKPGAGAATQKQGATAAPRSGIASLLSPRGKAKPAAAPTGAMRATSG